MSTMLLNDEDVPEVDLFDELVGYSEQHLSANHPEVVNASAKVHEIRHHPKTMLAFPGLTRQLASATANSDPQSAPAIPLRKDLRDWSESRPGYPVSFARSALFRAAKGKKDEVWNANAAIPIPATNGILMRYEGPRLDQQHALVFHALCQLTAGATQDLVIPHGDILKLIGVKRSTVKSNKWLWRHFNDMLKARIYLESDTVKYVGGLIHSITRDERTGMLAISLDQGLVGLFKNELIMTPVQERASLGRGQLTLWLHSYLSSHKRCFPITVTELLRLSGSSRELRIFRGKLRMSLKQLSDGTKPLIESWSIDENDRLTFTKRVTKVLYLGSGMAAARIEKSSNPASSYGVAKAREMRSKVAL